MNAPAYQVVIDYVTRKVRSGEWPPGHQLPTIRQLAVDVSASQTAVKTALLILRERGVVRGQQGKGTYVAGGAGRSTEATE